MRRCVLCGKSKEQVPKLILGLHGGICVDVVPEDLLANHWWLQRYDDRCYVLPG